MSVPETEEESNSQGSLMKQEFTSQDMQKWKDGNKEVT